MFTKRSTTSWVIVRQKRYRYVLRNKHPVTNDTRLEKSWRIRFTRLGHVSEHVPALPVVVALINASKKSGNCAPGYRVPDNTPV